MISRIRSNVTRDFSMATYLSRSSMAEPIAQRRPSTTSILLSPYRNLALLIRGGDERKIFLDSTSEAFLMPKVRGILCLMELDIVSRNLTSSFCEVYPISHIVPVYGTVCIPEYKLCNNCRHVSWVSWCRYGARPGVRMVRVSWVMLSELGDAS